MRKDQPNQNPISLPSHSDFGASISKSPAGWMTRRRFLQHAVAGSIVLQASARAVRTLLAGDGSIRLAPDHFVPIEKGLSKEWIRRLFEKGEPEWFTGVQLDTVGMPVGGICAGQVYLLGDGRLGYWDIFNQNFNTGYGALNWRLGRRPEWKVRHGRILYEHPVEEGFAVEVQTGSGTYRRRLDRTGFPKIRFRGEYPIGRVVYSEGTDFPVAIELEAFSPFIPLDAHSSFLPAVLLGWKIRNPSRSPVTVRLVGWLSNAICFYSRDRYKDRIQFEGRWIQKTPPENLGRQCFGIRFSARWKEQKEPPRPPEVFMDFEGPDYDGWTVEGQAFGKKPAHGTLPNQQPVHGFQGHGLVNTYLGGDAPQGRLLSPEFVIRRPYISFLIGGGRHPGKTCINLLINGKVVRSATGKNREQLEPETWDVREFLGRKARIEIVDRASGPWGHINVDRIEFRDEPLGVSAENLSVEPDYGTMGLYTLWDPTEESDSPTKALRWGWNLPPSEPDPLFQQLPSISPTPSAENPEGGWLAREVHLQPGEQRTVWFLVAWHMPNMRRGDRWVGNHYARHFADADAVAWHITQHLDRLVRDTRLWRDTYYDSTLPWWLLDRIHAPVANLATTTCQWWYNGRFWAWEGCGCCAGTCGHVWNYAQAMARLFPELERSVREMQDFAEGIGFHEDGSIGFRGEGWNLWAGDAQSGYILKAYREHLCSPDDSFLNRNWRKIRRALQFLIQQDKDNNGLLEGPQHQTYDENYYGPNTFVGALYLAALRAGEEMAREVGDKAFAETCRRLFETGSRLTVQRLFNGEYFIQEVDLHKHPEWQYGEGCLSDQLFGQNWAHQLGLGYLYPPKTVRSALQSIWKYNWAPDITPQNVAHRPERWFVSPGDAGLFTCTWPKSRHLGPRSTRYRNEIWTGIEYQVASHMAWEGLLTEALAICRAIHERYAPPRFNPWNEVECGDHYARALASWGMLLNLSGFEYHGPKGHLGFAPRLTPENFRCAFTAAEGWGTLSQTRTPHAQQNQIQLRWGRLRLRTLAFQLPEESSTKSLQVQVTLNGHPLPCRWNRKGSRLEIQLEPETLLQAPATLTVHIQT